MEGGAFQNKSLARVSRNDAIFVFLHQTREDSVKSYKLITEEYLEENFQHPAYLYFRPDGTEFDQSERMHHTALPAQRIARVLRRISKEWGKHLPVLEYEKALREIKAAEDLLRTGNWEEASGLLERAAGLRARCGVRDRATAILGTIEARKRMLAEWRSIEDAPRALAGSVEQSLLEGNPVRVLQILRKDPVDDEKIAAFELGLIAYLREVIRLEPLRFEKVYLSTGTLYQLKACWATDLPEFDGLGVQISYRTDRDQTLEGYGIYENMRPYSHHRAAVSLTARGLHYAEVVNARVQLWVADVMLDEAKLHDEPADFPPEESHVQVGPDLLGASESLSAGAKADVLLFKVGKYKPIR